MLHSKSESCVNRNIIKFAAAATALAVLAGCAIAMPLRPLATSSEDSRDRDFACRVPHPKCSNGSKNRRVVYRSSQPVDSGKIDEDPPDFILNSADQSGSLR
jgi:hypothetical protein